MNYIYAPEKSLIKHKLTLIKGYSENVSMMGEITKSCKLPPILNC